MLSRTLSSVGKSLPLRSASGQLGHLVGWTRLMSGTVQGVGSFSPSAPPPPTAQNSTPSRNLKRRPKRAPISNASPREWCRPLAPGVIPAYDLAIDMLKEDSMQIKAEADLLRTQIQAMEEKWMEAAAKEGEGDLEAVNKLDDELEAMRKKLRILEVQSEVNLPDVRWRVANAMPDMKKAVDRHLLEQKWRKDGDLDLLMERLYQMRVVPDLLSELHPSIDVRLAVNTLGMVPDKPSQLVEPGSFLLPRQTFDPPKIYASVFHTDTRLYTLLLLDPDVPDEATASYTTYVHWMQANIPLSANHTSRVIVPNNIFTAYIPPHPQQGTKYHRYVLLLLQQPPRGGSKYTLNIEARAKADEPTSVRLDIPFLYHEERKGFHLRSFMQKWGFDMRQGGGVHMWREVWDEHVSTIYKKEHALPKQEPRYGYPKKPDPYAALKQTKRYIS